MRRNYLLFMPSLIKRNDPPQIAYRSDVTDKVYYGRQTNVPASLLVLNKLNGRGEKLNGIIMICSDQVLNDAVSVEGKTQTTYEYYHDTIAAEMRQLGYSEIEIDSAFVKFSLNEINPGSWSSMDKVQKEMLDLIDNDSSADEATLFVDYTGGLRSASMLLVFFSKLLESQGVKVEDVFYSNISSPGLGHGDIESCMDTYHIFNYLNAFATESLDELGRVFSQDEDKEFNSLIQETRRAQKKNKRGKYSEITESDREAVSITEEMDILHRIAAKQINDVRGSLTPESDIRNLAIDNDSERAVQRVKEHGLDLLIKKGIIKWKSDFYNTDKKIKNAFYAYARYYRSYLDFIHAMLLCLDFSKETNELWEEFSDYTERMFKLVPLSKPKGGIAPAHEREFERKFSDVSAELKSKLIINIREGGNDVNKILQIVDNYIFKRDCCISAYLNGGNGGFPFANILNGWSYSRMGGNKWYDDQYKSSLNRKMWNLCRLPTSERERVRGIVVNDICSLAEAFPPVLCEMLFTVREDTIHSFGVNTLLMDSIRLGRNLFTHAGEKTTEDDETRMNQFIFDFLNWLDGNDNAR